MKIAFTILSDPRHWLRNYSTDKEWDSQLLKLMNAHRFEVEDHYVAKLGSQRIWIENYPYASFRPISERDRLELFKNPRPLMPSRRTVILAYQKLCEESLNW
jgi:hypothetical protein